ncbi:MAG TPA: cation:proton antiporter, partial [Abditibacterium sp.]
VTALQGGGGVNVLHLAVVTAQALGFVLLIALVGTKLMRQSSSLLDAPINPLSPLTLSLALCLGLAAAAASLGLAAIIGAFLAGTAAAETKQRHVLEKQLQPIMALLVPFFFVTTGAQVDLQALGQWPVIWGVVTATLLAVAGKIIGCGLGARALGRRSALIVGVGMVPRGEVGIIVASLGKSAGVFADTTYAIIIAMSLLTSVIAPPALGRLLQGLPAEPDDVDFEASSLVRIEETGHSGPARKPEPR